MNGRHFYPRTWTCLIFLFQFFPNIFIYTFFVKRWRAAHSGMFRVQPRIGFCKAREPLDRNGLQTSGSVATAKKCGNSILSVRSFKCYPIVSQCESTRYTKIFCKNTKLRDFWKSTARIMPQEHNIVGPRGCLSSFRRSWQRAATIRIQFAAV